ncbi:MAG TPA: rod shape-determining protein RodA [Actinomycetota bacterium]|nr:rod shape-determining protein RodA [Actinomycetota bacterium]
MSAGGVFSGRMTARATGTRAAIGSKSPARHMDLLLIAVALTLTAIGALAIRSASRARLIAIGEDPLTFVKRHLVFLVIASVLLLAALVFDYRQLRHLAILLYGLGVLSLVIVLTPLGHRTSGSQRWINLGVLQAQPSELMKIILIIALAALLSWEKGARRGLVGVVRALVITAIPSLLIYLQPDLGTVMVLIAVVFAMLLVAGTQVRWLVMVVCAGVLLSVALLQLGVLKEYQVARLTAFLDTESDLQRAGYNLDQSKIAIGSGGWEGKGLLSPDASQTNLAYVPEQHTDFVFTAIGEEAGFRGAVLVLGLFGLLLWRTLRVSLLSKDKFGTLLAAGIAAMFGFQVFVNIGMTIGIMPITGIPLPFVSYGGSSLITSFLGVGLLVNIHMRRFV